LNQALAEYKPEASLLEPFTVLVLIFFPKILTPFLLRRVKADVALNIPPKKELLVYAPMSPVQLELYRATVEHNYNRLLRRTEEVSQIKCFSLSQIYWLSSVIW
jgi:SNF2 family DNA or RNA helicase